MKRFHLMLLVAVGVLFFCAVAAAGRVEALGRTEPLTVGTLSLNSGGFTSVNLRNGLGSGNTGATTVRVVVVDDGTTATTRVVVRLFATSPSSGDLDGSTLGKTGVPVEEGNVLELTTTAGFLGIKEDASLGGTKVRVYRVE